jgi:hypothetical protein
MRDVDRWRGTEFVFGSRLRETGFREEREREGEVELDNHSNLDCLENCQPHAMLMLRRLR